MKRNTIITGAVCAVLGSVAAAVPSARGAATTFFGEDLQPDPGSPTILTSFPNASAARAKFLSNLTGVTTQDFESYAVGTTTPIAAAFGTTTATIASDSGVIKTGNSPAPAGPPEYTFGRFATSGTNYLDTNTSTSVTFSAPQVAFGFYGIDIGDQGGLLTLTLANGADDVLSVPANTTTDANGSVLYYGVIEPATSAFTAVTFGDTTTDDSFGFDDLTIGTAAQVAVPEPASAGLLAVGVVAAAAGRRRR